MKETAESTGKKALEAIVPAIDEIVALSGRCAADLEEACDDIELECSATYKRLCAALYWVGKAKEIISKIY